MKKVIYSSLLVFFGFLITLHSQVPNAGFENWTTGEPDSWLSNNSTGLFTTITQSNSSHTGSSALKGEVVFVSGFGNFTPLVVSDDGSSTSGGFAVTQKYNSLKGFYKLNTSANDKVLIILAMYVGETGVGAGVIMLNAAATYSQFAFPIGYDQGFSGTPDRCGIAIQITDASGSGTNVSLGSEMYIDDLELSMDVVSDVEDQTQPLTFQLEQNYPNPFNPSTRIKYQIAENDFVSLKVYDVLGNEVATLVNEEQTMGNYSATFNASSLSSGTYFYKLQTGSFVETKKMVLMK
jgi:hypothetical protein